MLKWLIGLFTAGPLYIRINRERIAIRNVSTGDSFECRALIGLDRSDRVASIGYPVSPEAVNQVNPFEHPRVLVGDFTVAEKMLTYAIRQVFGVKYLLPSPIVLLHPDLELQGGLTFIEARALRELAETAGARKVVIHFGRVLSDDDVKRVTSEA